MFEIEDGLGTYVSRLALQRWSALQRWVFETQGTSNQLSPSHVALAPTIVGV